MDAIGLVGGGGIDGEQSRPRRPCHRKIGRIDGVHRSLLADDGRDGLALEAHVVGGKDRLVGKGRDHAEDVAPGHVGGRQDPDQTGTGGEEGVEIAEREGGMVVRRTVGADMERVSWNRIGAIGLAAVNLRPAVKPDDAGADSLAGQRAGHRAQRPDRMSGFKLAATSATAAMILR